MNNGAMADCLGDHVVKTLNVALLVCYIDIIDKFALEKIYSATTIELRLLNYTAEFIDQRRIGLPYDYA